MKNKSITLFSILLILSTGMNSLFSANHHQCKLEVKKQESHCPMEMEKMDCCPVETHNNSCKCPEMNSENNLPSETSPVVLLNSISQTFGKYLTFQIKIFKIENQIVREYVSFEILNTPLYNNKIYKSVQTFLI